MNLNQVTVPSIDVAASVNFYTRLGLRQIVASLPDYARFECPDGGATFSIHRVDRISNGQGIIVYFECEELDTAVDDLKKERRRLRVRTSGPVLALARGLPARSRRKPDLPLSRR
jgi:catechol 2,3-dioxygenase-like lactoylglutathione lyase family enzyme